MKTLAVLSVVALLVTQFPPQVGPPRVCSIDYFSGSSVNVYQCATGAMYDGSAGPFPVTTPVSKTWFKAHCTTKGANKALGYDTVAVCDAYAVADPALTAKDAAGPSKVKQRLTEAAVIGVGVLIIFACAAGGGCAFAGGGE